jgi:uncharacterized protein YaaW (UPF0174 family)
MIPPEHVFQVLPPEKLRDIAHYLAFDPPVGGKLFSQISEGERLAWVDTHRNELEEHFRSVGSSIFGKRRSYREILLDTAKKVGASYSEAGTTLAVENAIVSQVWKQALEDMTGKQRTQVRESIAELASKHGRQIGTELSGFAALGAAQLSGFGIYMAGSTLLGSINGALGLGLGFGAFTGLSSLISVVIGPVGWAALGLFTVAKPGGPNYKKIIPVIFVVATYRAECADADGTSPTLGPRPKQTGTTPTACVSSVHGPVTGPIEHTPITTAPGDKKLQPATFVPASDIRALEAEIKEITQKRHRRSEHSFPRSMRSSSCKLKAECSLMRVRIWCRRHPRKPYPRETRDARKLPDFVLCIAKAIHRSM